MNHHAVSLDKMPDPAWWKQQSKDAKGKPLLCIIDDYSTDVGKDEKKNIEMMLRTCASHLGTGVCTPPVTLPLKTHKDFSSRRKGTPRGTPSWKTIAPP